ncbi:MAG: ATP-binding protein, partial [Bacteroidales bacterium]|nr:ATP-binding protein [Candidatus Cryptobacteroides aphodequi]
MATLFTYDRPVTGKNHIGRKDESDTLRQLIEAGRNIVIYEPPKTGKSSLIAQTLYAMRLDSVKFNCLEISLLNVRSTTDLLFKLAGALLDHFTTTPSERTAFAQRYLAGTHFVIDGGSSAEGTAAATVSLGAGTELDARDIRTILAIPYRLAEDRGEKLIVILDEFQNINLCEDNITALKLFEDVVRKSTAEQQSLCSWIWTGSQVNAMKEIFEKGAWFNRMAVRVTLGSIPYKDIETYIVRAFLTGGKVIEKSDLQTVAESLECNV